MPWCAAARARVLRLPWCGSGSVTAIPGARSATVRVTGQGSKLEQRLTEWQPLALRDLPSGDFRVEVELGGARVDRVVTVNRDLK